MTAKRSTRAAAAGKAASDKAPAGKAPAAAAASAPAAAVALAPRGGRARPRAQISSGRRCLITDYMRMPSARREDGNGFLHVKAVPVTRVQRAPYTGSELQPWVDRKLDPERIYYVLRPAEELASPETVRSINGIPLQLGHHFVFPDKPALETQIGYTGSDAAFSDPFLTVSLTISVKKGIDALESGRCCDISLGYSCTFEYSPGQTADGEHYDFIMRDIRANHAALVEMGRAGPEVRVPDSAPPSLRRGRNKDHAMEEKIPSAPAAAAPGDTQPALAEFAEVCKELSALLKELKGNAVQAATPGAPADMLPEDGGDVGPAPDEDYSPVPSSDDGDAGGEEQQYAAQDDDVEGGAADDGTAPDNEQGSASDEDAEDGDGSQDKDAEQAEPRRGMADSRVAAAVARARDAFPGGGAGAKSRRRTASPVKQRTADTAALIRRRTEQGIARRLAAADLVKPLIEIKPATLSSEQIYAAALDHHGVPYRFRDRSEALACIVQAFKLGRAKGRNQAAASSARAGRSADAAPRAAGSSSNNSSSGSSHGGSFAPGSAGAVMYSIFSGGQR